jgi:hypothetical protein
MMPSEHDLEAMMPFNAADKARQEQENFELKRALEKLEAAKADITLSEVLEVLKDTSLNYPADFHLDRYGSWTLSASGKSVYGSGIEALKAKLQELKGEK